MIALPLCVWFQSAPRKPLLLLGGLVIGFGHFLTALSYHFSLTVRWPFTVLGTMLVICGYAVSYGPLIWVGATSS